MPRLMHYLVPIFSSIYSLSRKRFMFSILIKLNRFLLFYPDQTELQHGSISKFRQTAILDWSVSLNMETDLADWSYVFYHNSFCQSTRCCSKSNQRSFRGSFRGFVYKTQPLAHKLTGAAQMALQFINQFSKITHNLFSNNTGHCHTPHQTAK